jgi:DNA primase
MTNQLLISLVNSLLGEGKPTSRENLAYFCPQCHHHKRKLEICFAENKEGMNRWACWNCGDKFKGKKLITLFKKLNASKEKIKELKSYVKIYDYEEKAKPKEEAKILELPKEFKSLVDPKGRMAKHALSYLRKREIFSNDIIKYGLGYCEYGKYKNMIILPSFDENGKLNYFTARSFEKEMFGEEPSRKYDNPPVSRDIIPFELYINWSVPIILCEGFFDAIAIKRNVIPLLGKSIQNKLMKKLVESSVQKIYIALDKDAMKQALYHCETLMDEGKEIYLVNLEEKDPSEMGTEKFINIIQDTPPLTYKGLLEKKLEMI